MTDPANLFSQVLAGRDAASAKTRAISRYVAESPVEFVRSSARDVCARLSISEPTLIRFCQSFGYAGLAEFRIDLALALSQGSRIVLPNPSDRRSVNLAARRAMARRAVGLVANDQSLLVDNGSTAEIFADALNALEGKTVMTTGLAVAHNLTAGGRHTVMLPGGTIRPDTASLAGRLVDSALAGMRFDTVVLSADSIDPDHGISTLLEDEAHQNRVMIASSARVCVLADRSKFGRPGLHVICRMDAVSVLVTDLPSEDERLARIRDRGVEIITIADQDPPA